MFPEEELSSKTYKVANTDKLVLCGYRHHNIIGQWVTLTNTPLPPEHEQGFLTSTNRFVDRVEALQIAFKAGQGKQGAVRDKVEAAFWYPSVPQQLYSEDLY